MWPSRRSRATAFAAGGVMGVRGRAGKLLPQMSKNLLVISVDVRETRVALIEDGIIAELHLERKNNPFAGSVGNVVLGKVTRVLPGLQAAFIDIGQERAAFLHVEDLIRPDDFDTYLQGGRKHATSTEEAPAEDEVDEAEAAAVQSGVANGVTAAVAIPGAESVAALPPSDSHADVGGTEAALSEPSIVPPSASEVEADASSLPDLGEAAAADASVRSDDSADDALDGGDEDDDDDTNNDDVDDGNDEDGDGERDGDPDSVPPAEGDAPAAEATHTSEPARATTKAVAKSAGGDELDLPGFTITEPGEPVPRAPAPPRGGGGERGAAGGDRGGRGDRQGGGRDRNRNGAVPNRISKSTPIRDVVREGQEIIVQVTKDPIGTKGARCSSHISLPGRYVVYLPTVDHIGISKRIGSEKERARLREAIDGMKPPSGGLIVRTVAEGLTKKQLKADVGYLVRLWGEIAKKKEGARAPTLLSSELDIVLKTARDLFTDEIDQVVIDDKHQYERLCRFVEMFAPERVKDIELYNGDEPIFDAYGIEDEIGRALSRKVPLPSGGHLVIDQAEALTAIDVNTGRFVGKGSKDMEETILKTNLEAVNEIAYQLRFRNLGGLIILDLIDMEKHSNREKVRRTLEEVLQKDKAKTTLNRISDLGLIEMTRKRTRESLGRLLHEPCFYCDGTGQLQSKETIVYEILREIRRKRADLPGYTVQVSVHPAVADLLAGTEKPAVTELENRYMRKINVVPRKDYHLEQFDLQGK